MTPKYDRRDVLKRTVGLVVLTSSGASLAALGRPPKASAQTSAPAQASKLERIKQGAPIRVGYTAEAPFVVPGPAGDPTGVLAELIKAFFTSLGTPKVQWHQGDFAAMIPGLVADRFDVVVAATIVTPVRCGQIAFGNPDHLTRYVMVVHKGNPHNLRSVKDIARNSQVKVGVVTGAIHGRLARNEGVPEDRILIFPDVASRLVGLRSNRIQTILGGEHFSREWVKQYPEFEVVELTEQPKGDDGKVSVDYGAIAFQKQDTDLVGAYNSWLANARTSGFLLENAKRVGWTEQQLVPPDVTAKMLCAR